LELPQNRSKYHSTGDSTSLLNENLLFSPFHSKSTYIGILFVLPVRLRQTSSTPVMTAVAGGGERNKPNNTLQEDDGFLTP
jgi:hypothetical protein